MINIIRHIMHRGFILALIAMVLVTISCKKEDQSKSRPSQAINATSNESVFDEVKKRVDQNPNDVDALYRLADLYYQNGQYAEAAQTYKKVVTLKPDMGYAYFKMGTAYNRTDQPDEAVKAFNKAVTLMPKNAVAYNNLGIAYGKLGRFNDEIAALKKAVKIRPNYSSARYNLGVTYLKTGNKKAALREYESLRAFDESTAEALMQEINRAS